MELNGAVLVLRLTHADVLALPEAPERVWVGGDSETILASREKTRGFFREFFGNRIGETFDLQKQIKNVCPVGRAR
jgi:hypothetical protein